MLGGNEQVTHNSTSRPGPSRVQARLNQLVSQALAPSLHEDLPEGLGQVSGIYLEPICKEK